MTTENKTRFLEMWDMATKDEYFDINSEDDLHVSAACYEAALRRLASDSPASKVCNFCPVTWGPESELGIKAICVSDCSPYREWLRAKGDARLAKAKAIVALIGTTWEE